MSGHLVRAQLDIVARAMPQEPSLAQEVVDLESLARRDPERLQIEVGHPGLRVPRVQVHEHQDDARAIPRGAAVGHQGRVRHPVEGQALHLQQGGVLLPDPVHPADERREALDRVEVPVADLVLLRVQVLLVPGSRRAVLRELEDGPVDAVVRGERRGQHEPGEERGAPAGLELTGKDVGGVRPQVGPEEIAHRRLAQLAEVGHDLVLGGSPGEVRVGMGETDLRQSVHDPRPSERLCQEQDVRVLAPHLLDEPLPEPEGLGVRVVDAEPSDAAIDPEEHHVQQGLPEGAPVGGSEVDRIDVVVLLRRVLRGPDGPIRKMVEPIGMLGHPGVIGGHLEGKVQRHLEAQPPCGDQQAIEIVEGAEPRLDRGVAPLGRSDGPRAPGSIRARLEPVVRSPTPGPSDRMDGRQVDDIEPEPGDVRKTIDERLEGPGPFRVRAGRSGEDLVPGTMPGPQRVDLDLELLLQAGDPGGRWEGPDRGEEGGVVEVPGRLVQGDGEPVLGLLDPFFELGAIRSLCPSGHGLKEDKAFLEVAPFDDLPLDPLPQELAPGEERVHPGPDGEPVPSHLLDPERSPPTIVPDGGHRGFVPLFAPDRSPAQDRDDRGGAVGEDVGLHVDSIADHPLGGERSSIDLGRDVLDRDPLRALTW
jgi:hypothetical protein